MESPIKKRSVDSRINKSVRLVVDTAKERTLVAQHGLRSLIQIQVHVRLQAINRFLRVRIAAKQVPGVCCTSLRLSCPALLPGYNNTVAEYDYADKQNDRHYDRVIIIVITLRVGHERFLSLEFAPYKTVSSSIASAMLHSIYLRWRLLCICFYHRFI